MSETAKITRRDPISPSDVIALVLLTSLAAILRFHHLGARPLWFDEGMSLGCAQLSWGDSLKLAVQEPVQWPYYVLLRVSLLFGNSESWIRLPSALFMTASIPMMYVTARRLLGRTSGVIAAVLLAVNAEMVRYAQEARSYGMEIFLLLAALYALCKLVEHRTLLREAAYISICVLAVYTHMYAALVIAAQGFSILLLPARQFPFRQWLRIYLTVIVLTAPMWLFVARIPAIETSQMQPPSRALLYYVLQHLCGNAGPLMILLCLIILFASSIAAVASMRSEGHSEKAWTTTLPVLWAGLPFLVCVVVSYLGKPSFVERYMLGCVLGIILCTAALISQLRPFPLQLAVVGFFAVMGFIGVRNYYQADYEKIPEDYPALARLIARESRAGDGIVFYWPRMEILYSYYSAKLDVPFPRPTILYPTLRDPASLETLTPEGPPLSRLRIDGHPRVWLILHRLAEDRGDAPVVKLPEILETQLHMSSVVQLPTWTVILYSK